MSKRKRESKKKQKKQKKQKKIYCKICPNGTIYAGESGLYYHMKTHHGHIPNPRKKQKLPLPLPFRDDNIILRRLGYKKPKKPKNDTTNIGTTTSDVAKCLEQMPKNEGRRELSESSIGSRNGSLQYLVSAA